MKSLIKKLVNFFSNKEEKRLRKENAEMSDRIDKIEARLRRMRNRVDPLGDLEEVLTAVQSMRDQSQSEAIRSHMSMAQSGAIANKEEQWKTEEILWKKIFNGLGLVQDKSPE